MFKSKLFKNTNIVSFKATMCFLVAFAMILSSVMPSIALAEDSVSQDDPGIEEGNGSSGDGQEEDTGDEDSESEDTGDTEEDGDDNEQGDTGDNEEEGNNEEESDSDESEGDESNGSEEESDGEGEVLGEHSQPSDFIGPVKKSLCPVCCVPLGEPEDPDVIPNPPVPCGENMIINGDFEYPGVDPSYTWDVFPLNSTLTNWFGNWMPSVPSSYECYCRPDPALLELQAGVAGWVAQSGDQYAELDSDWNGHNPGPSGEPASISIYQDLSTIEYHYYNVSFYFSPRPGTPIEDNKLEFSWNGDVIEIIEEAGAGDVNWTKHEYTLQADSGTTRIQFSDVGNSNSLGTFIDLIEVEEICDLICEDLEGEYGWYGEYFNYLAAHSDMNLPSSQWPDKTHGDPLGSWTADWYASEYYRFNKIDANLEFGGDFFPFDFAPEEIHNGHDYHFGAHWSAKVTVPVAGDYDYTLTSDDDVWVYVDGSLAADNSGIHAPITINDFVSLTDEHIVDVFFAERHVVQSYMSFAFANPDIIIEPYWEECEEEEPSPCVEGLLWQIGDIEADIADNPSDELNWEEPYEFGVFPPFIDPFVVGTNSDDEFPWNSNANEPYADDFDVEFDYDSDQEALARLTLSWSPGKTGANNPENKEVFLDGVSIGTVERIGEPEPGWFTERKVWQDDFEFMLSPGPHTLNFKHYTGDGTLWDYVALEIIDCGGQQEVCVPGYGWADYVESSEQGDTKGGGSVSPDRSDPDSVLGEPDGVFYSLGQGGNIVVSFSHYVLDVEGNDLSFHETTYGRYSYPEEIILVEVSQDGIDWYEIGTASNHAPADGVDYLDFSSTGLPWIKYVRITDATDFDLHSNGADGYDLDAIDATYESCNYIELEKFGEFNSETGEITYVINWSVIGEGIAYDMVITDELPDGTSFVSADNGGTESSGVVTWHLGDITAPDSGTVSFMVMLDAFASMDVWADSVISFDQGLRKDGTPVLEERSHPENALGEAEYTDVVNFVSLGFGGELVLGFDNYIINGEGDDVDIVETSYGNPSEEQYPETVEVYASQCGDDWVLLGTIVLDGTVDLGELAWARYIKLIDVSDPNDFSGTTDGFDVDGVRAIHSLPEVCSIDNTAIGRVNTEPEGEGEVMWAKASTTTIINELACEDPCQDDGYASGMKFNDLNGNSEKDEGEEGLEGWTIYAGEWIETLEVDSNGPETGTPIDSLPLANGQKYFLRVSDTFYAGDSITADAKYSVREPNTEWTDIVQNYESWGSTLLDLHIDGIALDWGLYNPVHVYWYTLIGDGNPATLQIYDIYASNNVGSLTVEICKVIAEDITDIDGNYWLDLSGAEGKVTIAEQTQGGWAQTAPSPDGFYTVPASDASTGLDFGNQEAEEQEDPDPDPERGSITGMKFDDLNGNSEKDEGEEGLAGWIIYLDLNDNGEKDPGEPYQTTDNYGNYSFTDLEYDTYIVREEDQTGWSQTFPGYDFDYAYNLIIDSCTSNWHNIDFGNQEGEVEQQGGSTGGGGYYTPPAEEEDDEGDGEVAGDQEEDNGGIGGGEDVLGEQDEGDLAQTGADVWLMFLITLALSILAASFTYKTYNWQDR